MAQGWRDVVDHARDLGVAVPAGLTRREQAALVGHPELAGVADRAVFGYGEPEVAAVQAYWANCKRVKSELSSRSSRWKRVARLVSVRGLLFRDNRPVEHLAKPERVGTGRRLRMPALRRAKAAGA